MLALDLRCIYNLKIIPLPYRIIPIFIYIEILAKDQNIVCPPYQKLVVLSTPLYKFGKGLGKGRCIGKRLLCYARKLLNLEKEEEPIDIDSLTPEQMKEMLKKMMGQQ